MARLEHLGDDRWKIYVEVGPPGARVRKTRRFQAKGTERSRAVQAAARRIEVELTQQRLHLDPRRVTFGQAAEAWWQWWTTAQTRSATTAHEYRRQLDTRLVPDLGKVALERMTAGTLTSYYGNLIGRGLSASSVRAYAGLANQVLEFAVIHQWAARNVARDAKLPTQPPTRIRIPTADELNALFDAAGRQSPTARRGLVVAFGLGVRRGELAALRAGQIRWDERKVLINASVTDTRTGRTVKGTKTHQARKVPMTSWVEHELRAQLNDHVEAAERFGVPLDPNPWLWSMKPGAGERPTPDYFTTVFTRARAAAGVEGVRLHDLRHAFASWLLNEGTPMPRVAQLLGHASAATTARIYAHALEDSGEDQEAVDRLPAPAVPLPAGGVIEDVELVEDDDVDDLP